MKPRYPRALALLPALLALTALQRGGLLRPADAADPPPIPLPTGRFISPLGTQVRVGSFPANMRISPDGRYLVVTNAGFKQFLTVVRTADGQVAARLPFNAPRTDGSGRREGLYYGLAFGTPRDGVTPLYVARGTEQRVTELALGADGSLTPRDRSLAHPSTYRRPNHFAGLALSGDGRRLYAVQNNTHVQNRFRGSLVVFDTAEGKAVRETRVAGFPLDVAAPSRGAGAGKVYVSSERDGVVTALDPERPESSREITTGDHPTALLLDREQRRLFVANSGSDTVSVIDPATDRVTDTLALRPMEARGLPGATPLGMALAPDEKRLYVALADLNAVAVVDLVRRRLAGYLPVGWYPTSVALSPDGRRLFVANAKGVAERNPNGRDLDVNAPGARAFPGGYNDPRYIPNTLEGTVSTLPVPADGELERHTDRVIANNRMTRRVAAVPKGWKNPGIEHVIYVIKENRTYDQVLGDLPQGNGDPKLCFFPRPVTPNQHALAERFVLLDNFYVCAEVSADGWNWSTQGMISEYNARNSVYNYGGRGREYDYEGENNGVPVELLGIPDVNRTPAGYIWENAARHGVSFRNWGFFLSEGGDEGNGPDGKPLSVHNQPAQKLLQDRSDTDFLQFDMAYADSDAWVAHNAPAPVQKRTFGKHNARSRFEEWKREFDDLVRTRALPKFLMVRLPRDHTQGTSPGYHSPRAMVADNDYAVGQLVEAVSRSPYWKKTAIFIIEDDAQNGFDHVDAHRSVCWVISPYVRRASVDHRFYNTDSVLRTMQLLLGLHPMSQYDATAPVMDVFGRRPENAEPFAAILPERSIIAEVNGRAAYRAADSARLDFSKEDSVPDDLLNDILWHALMGRDTPKPEVRYGLRLHPEAQEREDDD